jgi:hypothetical protein
LAAQGTPFGQAGFVAYGTGSELELSAVHSSTTTLADVDQAFSGITAAGGTVGTTAVTSPITGAVVQPTGIPSGINATARGSGLEVGLGLTTAQADQIQAGIAQAKSPPPDEVGTPAGPTVSAVPLQISGLLQTGVLHGFAATSYNDEFCPVGQSIAYGLGSAAAATTALTTVVASPGDALSDTHADLIANPDGTFGLATEVAETIAPVQVSLPTGAATPTTITITVQGTSPSNPVTLTAATNGEGTSTLKLGNADPTVTVAIDLLGVAVPPITASLSGLANALNPLLGTGGSVSSVLSGLGIALSLNIGNGVTTTSPLPTFTNGTNAISGSYDLLALHAALGGTTIADLRVGHMEAAAALPTGSIACTVPVSKTSSVANVTAPGNFTWSINIPSSASALSDSSCDLVNIMATDKISVKSGNPVFTINTAAITPPATATTSGGVTTLTWSNLGTYAPGDPPITLTVPVSVSGGSGVLQDTANVTAGLGNCTGGVTGQTTLIGPNLGSVVVTGAVTFIGPTVGTATGPGLPVTGEGPALAWIAGGLLVLAYGTRKVVRKARSNS